MSTHSWINLEQLPAKSLFISDIHFGSLPSDEDEALQQTVIELLEEATSRGFTLFLLGDIFDYWLEVGNEVPPVAKNFNAKLADLAAYNSIYMVSGNHDNWTNGYFSKMGIAESKEGILTKDGILLAHGDGFKGKNYRLIRPLKHRLLRNPLFIKLFVAIFGVDGAWQRMQAFSKASSLKPKNTAKELQRLNNWAEDVIVSHKLNLVVCGHDHQARLVKMGNGAFLNTGYFQKDGTFGLLEGGMVRLIQLNSTDRNWKVISERSLS